MGTALALRVLGQAYRHRAQSTPHDAGHSTKIVAASYRVPHAIVAHTKRSPVTLAAGRAQHPSRHHKAPELRRTGRSLRSELPRKHSPGVVEWGPRPPQALQGPRLRSSRDGATHGPRRRVVLKVAGCPPMQGVEAGLASLPPRAWRRICDTSPCRDRRRGPKVDVLLLGHRSYSESGIGHLALGAGTPVVGPRMGAIEQMLATEPTWLFPRRASTRRSPRSSASSTTHRRAEASRTEREARGRLRDVGAERKRHA